MISPAITRILRALLLPVLLGSAAVPGQAQVVINELMAAGSERLLQYDANNVPKIGTGSRWYEASFNDEAWSQGPGPFGFGTLTNNPPTPIATNVGTAMRYLTPTLYLRKSFQVSEADQARPETVQLLIEYNDGFVAYLNGVEVGRHNGGPVGRFLPHDQPAYNRETYFNVRTGALQTQPVPTTTSSVTINIGAASAKLLAGTNVLSIHALNASELDPTFYFKANLRINTGTPVALVNHDDTWKYFAGLVEPAGAFYDPALLGAGRLRAPWGDLAFDDSTWASGPGPLGCGPPPAGLTLGTNLTAQVVNITPSVYARTIFSLSAAEAAETQPLQFTVQYDDGFVAYLNGVEIARRKIGNPNTFTPREAVADSATAATEVIVLDAPSKLLATGDNVLAIQIHNVAVSDPDLFLSAQLKTTGASNRVVVASAATWKYFIGTAEPVQLPAGEEDADSPEGPESALDWIELYNAGTEAVSLKDWSMTDRATQPRKWIFPEVSIPAGGYLVIVADGLDLKSNPGGYLHTNFSLDADGEYVGLFNANGVAVSTISPSYGSQRPFYSLARTSDALAFTDTPTPGSANAGTFFSGIVDAPTVDKPGRFYTGPVSVVLSCATPNATIRYTLNGTEPTEASPIAPTSLSFATNTPLRARAFLANYIPSDTISHTYIVNEVAARRLLPAVAFIGDPQRAFYRPFGIMAIVGGAYPSNWTQNGDVSAYNAPMQKGNPAERPIGLELLHDNATPDLRINAGVRLAGSTVTRPAYRLDSQNSATPNILSPWTPTSSQQKPQFNLFFRDDLGTRPLSFPLIPGSSVVDYESIRLRSGKNEMGNPFIRDEFTRRLFSQMGQVNVRGDFVNLYVNGVFKGYFNLCQRPREGFFQQARGSDEKFDVRVVDTFADGDTLAYNELMAYARTRDMTVPANYDGMVARLDLVNFADYLVLNTYAGTWDWPQNNTLMDRERRAGAKFRFSVWDAEGAFGQSGRSPTTWNQFTSTEPLSAPLITPNVATETLAVPLFYTVLRANPEFRLLVADRIRKHLFNDGALRNTNLTERWTELRNIMEPMLKNVLGAGTVMTDFATPWGTPRSTAVLSQYTAQGLWPATRAPEFSQFGGTVAVGGTLTISNPNAAGTIYFTTNGTDPRATGGATTGQPYSGPIPFPQSLMVKARVLNGTEWSPLTEATFATAVPPALVISEIMYKPLNQGAVDGGEFEYLEVMNVGATALNLDGMRIGGGIEFAFPSGLSLAPGARTVIGRNAAQLAVRYPTVSVAGQFTPDNLSNSGETLTLVDLAGLTIQSFAYGTAAPWPVEAATSGYSLVLIRPETRPNPALASSWRSSRSPGGNPGADDRSNFAAYAAANGGLADPLSDVGNHGVPLLLEYAFGRAPGQDPRSVLPTADQRRIDGEASLFLTLSFRRQKGAEDITYTPEFSTNLTTWPDGGVFVSSSANSDGTTTEVWRATNPIDPVVPQFGHVRVTLP